MATLDANTAAHPKMKKKSGILSSFMRRGSTPMQPSASSRDVDAAAATPTSPPRDPTDVPTVAVSTSSPRGSAGSRPAVVTESARLAAHASITEVTTADPVHLTLDGNKLVFNDGDWHMAGAKLADSGALTAAKKEATELKEQLRKAQDENRLLKFKVELLLDQIAGAQLDAKEMKQVMKKKDGALSRMQSHASQMA